MLKIPVVPKGATCMFLAMTTCGILLHIVITFASEMEKFKCMTRFKINHLKHETIKVRNFDRPIILICTFFTA